MNLVDAVEALQKEPLTAKEVATLQNWQRIFSLADDDPIIVVLAIMVRSQLIIESAPDLLQQKVLETIELHRTNLREQAVLSAKELITDLSAVLLSHQKDVLTDWRQRAYGFAAGAVTMALLLGAALLLVRLLHWQ